MSVPARSLRFRIAHNLINAAAGRLLTSRSSSAKPCASSKYQCPALTLTVLSPPSARSYNTNFNILLVVFQALAAIFLCSGAKAAGKIDYPEFQKPIAMQWLPVNLIFCGMLYTSMQALTHNNVPMVTVFKNIANIFIAAGGETGAVCLPSLLLYSASVATLEICKI